LRGSEENRPGRWVCTVAVGNDRRAEWVDVAVGDHPVEATTSRSKRSVTQCHPVGSSLEAFT
jgi:hypothetical protein